MTDVRIGDYRISADANNWTVEREQVIEKGKNVGQKQLVLVGYFNRLDAALDRTLDEHARRCGATTLDALLAELRWFREQARMATRGEDAGRAA